MNKTDFIQLLYAYTPFLLILIIPVHDFIWLPIRKRLLKCK